MPQLVYKDSIICHVVTHIGSRVSLSRAAQTLPGSALGLFVGIGICIVSWSHFVFFLSFQVIYYNFYD